jgi:iron(III) transport system permease protein
MITWLKKKISISNLPTILIFLLLAWYILTNLILPNLNVIYTTFISEDGSLTLTAVNKLLSSPRAMRSMRNSIVLAFSLAVTVNIVGIFIVLVTEYFEIKGSKILRLGFMTTLIYGGVVLVSGYKFIYGPDGYVNKILLMIFPNMKVDWFIGYWAVLYVMTFAITSNHMMFLTNAIRTIDFQTVEAAKNMGASQWTILRRVVLPVLLPTILAVTILVMVIGLNATSAPLIVGGTGFQTISPMILSFSRMPTARDLAALLALFLGLVTVILLTIMIQIEKRGNYISVSKVKTRIVKQKINNKIVNATIHFFSYLLFLIYTLPVILIVIFSFTDSKSIATRTLSIESFTLQNYIDLITTARSYRPVLVSVVYSVLASIAVVIIVMIAVRIIHKYKNIWASVMEYALLIPWMIPSTMIAIGFVITYDTPKWYMFNKVLSGTMIILFLAYVVIKIPFTLRMTKASFFSIDFALEDAARNLGASEFYTFVRVLLPIILPSTLAVLALNINSLLTNFDLSVFLYHPIYQPLGVYIRSLTDMQNADNIVLTFVYAVIVMVLSALTLFFVNRQKGEKITREI